MAILQSIFISGIRSYGIEKEDAQSFKFYTPLTLFLGQNGCGKTTIIECIRHSLTGDFPAGGKSGHFFVADPNLYQMPTVKGCIKLKFNDVYGNKATISRTLRLDSMNGKLTFKSMDSTYEYVDQTGKIRQISAKLNDCKEMISSLVGVSEAVLNNVLLCHQEESLWPLSEDGNVKKKFDLIFDSNKYDCAVDAILKQIKIRSVSLKMLKQELVMLKDMKTTVRLKQKNLNEKKECLELLMKETEEFAELLVPIKARLEEVLTLEQNVFELSKLKNFKENELKSNETLQKTFNELIKVEFEGTDKELEEEIANFQKRFQEKNKEVSDVEKHIADIKSQYEQIASEQQNKKSKIAGLQVEIQSCEHKMVERDEIVKKLLQQYGQTSSDDFHNNYTVVKSQCADEIKTVAVKEKEFQESETELQKEVEVAQDALMKVRSEDTLKRQDLAATTKYKHVTDCQLEELSASDKEFKNYQRKIARVESEIENLMATYNEDAVTKTMDKNRKTVRDLNEKLEELENEMKIFMKNSYTEKEIENQRSDLISKEREIRNLKNKHHNEFKEVFPNGLPAKNLKMEVAKTQCSYSNKIRTLKEDLTKNEKESSIYETELRHIKVKVASMKQEFDKGNHEIDQLCGEMSFEAKRQKVEERNTLLQKERGQLSSCKIIYKEFLKNLEDKKCCPVCETNFAANMKHLNQIVSSMNTKIVNIPERLVKVSKNLEDGEKLYADLLKLIPVHAKITELVNEIPIVEQKVASLSRDLAIKSEALAKMKKEIKQEQNIYDACVQIVSSAALIDQYTEDVAKAEGKIEDLTSRIIAVESNRTKAETEATIDESTEDIKKLGDENERLSKKMTTNQKRLNDLRSEKNELIDAQLKLQRLVQGKPQLLEKQKELEDKEKRLTQELETMEMQLISCISDVEETKYKLKSLKDEHNVQLSSIRTHLQSHEATLKDIQRLHNEINVVQAKELPQVCKRLQVEIGQFMVELEDLEKEIQKHLARRDDIKAELCDKVSASDSLQNNKKLREHKRAAVKIKQSLKSVMSEIKGHDYSSIDREKKELLAKIGDFDARSANIQGQIKSLNTNIEDIVHELNMAGTKDPIRAYATKYVEIRFETEYIEELRAMMMHISVGVSKFHREQLYSINLRLKEMWKAIYKGNDIEYIQVESGETELSTTKRVYNYCVVQKKGDISMQMRGKCSAGQKVLACLLIRIVLSEHFSIKCGIFALDEPTTNLDRDNIRSLSQSIASLVNSHQNQRNFQFLIITHDEEFLDALREVDAAREYYKVSRNFKGNTVITTERV